jgi:hypothetical protein
MVVASVAFGAACRVIYYTTLLLAASNMVTIEFEVARATNADGVVFCFDSGSVQTRDSKLTYLYSGGSIFSNSGTTSVTGNIQGVRRYSYLVVLLKLALTLHIWAQALLSDIFSNDPYYATSYTSVRYQDIEAYSDMVISLPYDSANLNCVVLEGTFEADVRYEANFTLTNPTSTAGDALNVWYAPVSKKSSDTYLVRGSKLGQKCGRPAQLSNILGTSSPFTDSNATVASCAALVSNSTAYSYLVYSPWAGGQCISCQCSGCVYAYNSGAPTCGCATGYVAAKVGEVPCIAIGSDAKVDSLAELPSHLCSRLEEWQTKVKNGWTSATVVALQYKNWMYLNGGLKADMEDILSSMAHFNQTYLRDGRRLDFPTHRYGINPPGGHCAYCDSSTIAWTDPTGIADAVTQRVREIRDDGWLADVGFASLGYVLHDKMSKSCPSLWNPSEPYKVYGTPSTTMPRR